MAGRYIVATRDKSQFVSDYNDNQVIFTHSRAKAHKYSAFMAFSIADEIQGVFESETPYVSAMKPIAIHQHRQQQQKQPRWQFAFANAMSAITACLTLVVSRAN